MASADRRKTQPASDTVRPFHETQSSLAGTFQRHSYRHDRTVAMVDDMRRCVTLSHGQDARSAGDVRAPWSLRRGCVEENFRDGVVSGRSCSWNWCAAVGRAAGHEEPEWALAPGPG